MYIFLGLKFIFEAILSYTTKTLPIYVKGGPFLLIKVNRFENEKKPL